MALVMRRYRFTLDDYHRMGEAGILTEDDRVELVEGEIIAMSPAGTVHASVVDRLNMLFAARVVGRAIVRVQNSLTLPDHASELEPDLQLLRPRPDFYIRRRPLPSEVLLVVEVMDSTVRYDRGVKRPLYARAGLAETWLVALGAGHIEVNRDPHPAGYRTRRIVERGERLAPLAFPDLVVGADDILGPPTD